MTILKLIFFRSHNVWVVRRFFSRYQSLYVLLQHQDHTVFVQNCLTL